MLHDTVSKKIPGILLKDKDGQLDDLSKYSIPQLKELITRQEKIISNKKFVSKLPDKGEKLFRKLSELKREYSERCDVSKLAEEVKKLSVSHEEAVVSVEWTRETKQVSESSPNREESEREEERYIGLLLAKVGKDERKTVFKPNRTIHSQRDESPPLLSLQESFILQKQQATKLKEAEVKQASERLLRQMYCYNADADASTSSSSAVQFLDYRDPREDDDHDDDD